MKKITLFLLLISWCAISVPLVAQQAPVLYSLQGKGKFRLPSGKTSKLKAGQELTSDGTLTLGENTRVGVYLAGAFLYLDGPATVSMASLQNDPRLRETAVSDLFGAQLTYSAHPYFSRSGFGAVGVEEEDTGTSAPKKKGKSGAGNKDRKVSIQSPLAGKVAGPVVTFRWVLRKPDAGVQRFRFRLINDDDEPACPQCEQTVSGYSLSLNLNDLELETERTYRWSVAATDQDDVDSGPIELYYASPTDVLELRERLFTDPAYLQASPPARALLAYPLYIEYDYHQAAKEALETARKQDPKNPLVQRMYQGFWYLYDLEK